MVKRISLPAARSVDDGMKRRLTRAFRTDGVVWIGDLLTRRFVGQLKNAFQQRYSELTEGELARRFAAVGDRRYMISVELQPPFRSPKLYANDLLLPIIHDLVGADCVISSFSAVVSLPGAEDQPVHFDFPPLFESEKLCVGLPPYALTMVVPLLDLADSTGATAVWPQSHRRVGSRRQLQRLYQSGAMTGASLPLLKMGDVLLMDARLIHAGTANRSSDDRPVLYIVFNRPWFREPGNFTEQPAINISTSQLLKVPAKHRHLFAAANQGW